MRARGFMYNHSVDISLLLIMIIILSRRVISFAVLLLKCGGGKGN